MLLNSNVKLGTFIRLKRDNMKQKIKNYFKYWQYLSQLKFSLAMKLSLIVVITAFIVSGSIIYFSAKQLKQEKNNFINN